MGAGTPSPVSARRPRRHKFLVRITADRSARHDLVEITMANVSSRTKVVGPRRRPIHSPLSS